MDKEGIRSALKYTAAVAGMMGLIFLAIFGIVAWSDYDADWGPEYKFIPATNAMTVFDQGKAATDSFMISVGAGIAPIREVGSRTASTQQLTVGFAMNVGDEIVFLMPWPETADSRFNAALRTLYTSTNTNGPTWQYFLKDFDPNGAEGVADAALHGSGVDSVTATRDSVTAGRPTYSKWDTTTFATTKAFAGRIMKLGVKLNAMSASVVAGGRGVWLYGVELAYVPKRTTGAAARQDSIKVPGFTSLGIEKGATLRRK